jgi:hypothetical protein
MITYNTTPRAVTAYTTIGKSGVAPTGSPLGLTLVFTRMTATKTTYTAPLRSTTNYSTNLKN